MKTFFEVLFGISLTLVVFLVLSVAYQKDKAQRVKELTECLQDHVNIRECTSFVFDH